MAVAAWFYGWTATSAGSPLTWERPTYDLYNRLTDAFLAGQTSFLEEPPAELAALADPYDPAQNAPYKKFHDVTYYRGRYYLYFGPVPAVVLLAPWKVLTGTSLPQNVAVVVFAWAAALQAVLLLLKLRRRYFPTTPVWLVLAMAVAVVFGSLLPLLLRRPYFYELAIASACFFGLTALSLLLEAGEESRRRPVWLAGAGLCLGLAVASRPNYFFGGTAVVAFCLVEWWRRAAGVSPRARLRHLAGSAAVLLLPFAACLAALLCYNYARFGRITEFGTSYMLAGTNQLGVFQIGLRYVPTNLYYHLVAPPRFSVYFPFVETAGPPPFVPPADYSGQENMFGVAVALPFLWALVFVWAGLRPGAPAQAWQSWVRIATGFAVANAAFLWLMMGAANRYLIDSVPVLMVLAALGVMQAESAAGGWRRWVVRAAWVGALTVTLGFNVFVSFQHNELLRYRNPETFQRLAHTFNSWSQLWQQVTGRPEGPLRIELALPKDRTGRRELLVVTGLPPRNDFVYLLYPDDRHIQISFEHADRHRLVSPPIEVDYDLSHVLEVQMGSLYPPIFHPYYDGWTVDEILRRKRTLLVKLDGREVLAGQCAFYDSSPGDVTVGHDPESGVSDRRFTGTVRSINRIGGRQSFHE